MGAPLREVDIDMGEPSGPRRSVASLTLPLQWVAILLVQTTLGVVWLDHRFGSLEREIVDQGTALRAEIYHQQDAARDLALRDQRIDELTRRIAVLEGYIDARGHGRTTSTAASLNVRNLSPWVKQ